MRLLSAVLAGITLYVLCGCNRNDSAGKQHEAYVAAVPPTKTDSLIAGKQIFEEKCVACHGSDGTAGIAGAANLQTMVTDSAAISQTVTNGKKAMPAFGKTLSASDIEEVTRYVKSLHR